MTEQTNPIPRMRTIRCAAEELQIPENALRMWIKEGLIPAVYTGNRALVNLELLIDFLRSGGQNNGSKADSQTTKTKD